MPRFRNPLVDPTPRHPMNIGKRAARWGALACVIGVGAMAIPVGQGLREGRAGAPAPVAETPWQELRLMGWEIAQEEGRQ